MDFLRQYWGQLGLGTLALLWLLKHRQRILQMISRVLRGQLALEVSETQGQLADGYQKQKQLIAQERDQAIARCAQLAAERDELKRDLAACVRKLDLRDEINTQDRATIRTLRGQCVKLRGCVRELRECLADNSLDHSVIIEVVRLDEETDVP